MNIYSYFPTGLHKELDAGASANEPLVVSGVNNSSAKTFLISDYVQGKKFRNIFWVSADDNIIYEIKNNFPFWRDGAVVPMDHLMQEDQDDYRITEAINAIHNETNRVYLLNQKDMQLPLPTYDELKAQGVVVNKDDDINIVEFFNRLIGLGYQPSADVILSKGEYRRSGGVVNVFPPTYDHPIKIEVDFGKVEGMWLFDQEKKAIDSEIEKVDFLPIGIQDATSNIFGHITEDDLLIIDDIDEHVEGLDEAIEACSARKFIFTSFPKNDEKYFHMRYLSVLKYYNIFDLLNDVRDKYQRDWTINILTKRVKELTAILNEEKIRYSTNDKDEAQIRIIDAQDLENVPASFQNPEYKIQLLTDKEIFNISRNTKQIKSQKVNIDFLTSLKMGDLVVHFDHGIGRFLGVVPRTIDEIIREYLEIAYAENDRLFVPIDQADKISKYVGGEDNEPNLSRLGSAEWKNVTQKIKKETKKIAKELLKLYAKRAQVKGHDYGADTDDQQKFDAAFPYEETPGQMKAIADVKKDMEGDQPMDRLVCGDVGFGKTEVAMRAAFKAVQGGKQVAFIAPITILADQHYKSFKKRAADFDIRIEQLSRFKTPKQQREIIEALRKGDVDIVIGTHRLLQPDVNFFNLGLVIIDEEQRFGVKQKEKFKELRTSVDILTMTATPIPRTLNFALNKLRDISTITTPPPGRLPIITEVRRYSDQLIIESIEREIARGGQVYFLHNRVQTIEGIAEKLRKLVPNVSFIVAHGQLSPQDLEERIMKFKKGEAQVLVSSTIVENGIDLPNANTLIVDNAENFGLSQLYQLRGRIGRGKTQAYAYFLYQSRQPRLDAKKRLRAIVDASELGSGFQVAMRDLEIRGAGDILGINQSGSINVVGVNHFLRMLNKTVEEMRAGKESVDTEEKQDVTIELPIEAYIPDTYIPDTKSKINVYQKLSSVDHLEILDEFEKDLETEYGQLPEQVRKLLQVLEIKILGKQAGLLNVKAVVKGNAGKEIVLHMGPNVTPEPIMNVLKHNMKWLISGDKLKIDMKDLGFNWMEGLKESIRQLIPKLKKKEQKAEKPEEEEKVNA